MARFIQWPRVNGGSVRIAERSKGRNMKLSQRSKLSLCQFLRLFPKGDLTLLLGKYEWSTDNLERLWDVLSLAEALKEVIVQASDSQLQGLVQELTRTNQSMRTGVSPKYHFEQRWRELCLRAPLRIRDLTEDDWLNGLWPSAAMLAPEFPGVSRAPIELSPLQDRAQVISYSEYCHTAAARRSSWTRRRML